MLTKIKTTIRTRRARTAYIRSILELLDQDRLSNLDFADATR